MLWESQSRFYNVYFTLDYCFEILVQGRYGGLVEWRGFYAGLIWVMAPHAFRLLHAPRLKFCNATQSLCKMQNATMHCTNASFALRCVWSYQLSTRNRLQHCSTNSTNTAPPTPEKEITQLYKVMHFAFLNFYLSTVPLLLYWNTACMLYTACFATNAIQ